MPRLLFSSTSWRSAQPSHRAHARGTAREPKRSRRRSTRRKAAILGRCPHTHSTRSLPTSTPSPLVFPSTVQLSLLTASPPRSACHSGTDRRCIARGRPPQHALLQPADCPHSGERRARRDARAGSEGYTSRRCPYVPKPYGLGGGARVLAIRIRQQLLGGLLRRAAGGDGARQGSTRASSSTRADPTDTYQPRARAHN